MDFKVQISFTMFASVVVGQITSYICLLTFPAHWGIAPDRAIGQDQSRIVLVRMGRPDASKTPAVTEDGRTVTLNRGEGGGTARNRQARCTCAPDGRPTVNRVNVCTGKCGACSSDRRRGLAAYSLPETYEVHGMDSYRLFPQGNNPMLDTNLHFNFIASFITHLFLVYGLQIIKKSSVKMDTVWMAIFVSAILSVVYTLLASNNNSWRNRSFSTAFMLTLHKFVLLLSMNLTLTMSRVIDTLY